jgi:hypothetical protein
VEGLLQDSHADERCGLQDQAEPSIEDDGDIPGPDTTLTGTRSGQAAFRKEQLESNHRDNQDKGKEGEANHRRYKDNPRKEEMAVCL